MADHPVFRFQAILALGLVLVVGFLIVSLFLPRGRVRELYREHLGNPRRERLFLSWLAFFGTFATVRGITHSIHAGVGPFHNIIAGQLHIHHLVLGIWSLLLIGYLWLLQIGTGEPGTSKWMSRLTAALYGLAAALTLDEFALWLNLQDVYWARQGRESVDAVILFGAILGSGLVGARFLHALVREASRVVRRK